MAETLNTRERESVSDPMKCVTLLCHRPSSTIAGAYGSRCEFCFQNRNAKCKIRECRNNEDCLVCPGSNEKGIKICRSVPFCCYAHAIRNRFSASAVRKEYLISCHKCTIVDDRWILFVSVDDSSVNFGWFRFLFHLKDSSNIRWKSTYWLVSPIFWQNRTRIRADGLLSIFRGQSPIAFQYFLSCYRCDELLFNYLHEYGEQSWRLRHKFNTRLV